MSLKRYKPMNTKMFWYRVKSCIKEKGLTQQEAAKALRFSFSTFRNWMSKNVNPPLIYATRISKYLGVSLEYLIYGHGKDSIYKRHEKVLLLLKELEVEIKKIRRN
jgi:transcriptional regulator with XRE-family HTH domain